MSEKPILFNTEMVRAILDGRKTMTRRVIKSDVSNQFDIDTDGTAFAYIDQATGYSYKPQDICKYKVGDILWVRETWRKNQYGTGWSWDYKASPEYWNMPEEWPWKPSIFMPRDAARIFLKVTGVRVERVQEITEDDAMDEGVKDPYDYQPPAYYEQPQIKGLGINKSAFAGLWDSINAKRGYGWDKNSWVWVIDFERVNEDESKM